MADTKLSAIATKIASLVKSVRYYISDGTTTNKYSDLEQLASWIQGFRTVRAPAARNLTNSTASQAIFDSANDVLTLPTGTYLFEALLSISGMSATSGNYQFQLLGAGSAVLADILFIGLGVDGATATSATQTGSTSVTANSPTSMLTAGTGTGAQALIKGTFEVTTAGTIIPSLALVTASAAVLAAGSYFQCTRIGDAGMASSEDWS